MSLGLMHIVIDLDLSGTCSIAWRFCACAFHLHLSLSLIMPASAVNYVYGFGSRFRWHHHAPLQCWLHVPSATSRKPMRAVGPIMVSV